MSDEYALPPVPDVTLTPPALLGGPQSGLPGGSFGLPPLSLGGTPSVSPLLTTPTPGAGPLFPGLLPTPDYFRDFPAPAAGGGNPLDALGGLGTRPGLQADKDGVGTTAGDWVLRFMPYVPYLNEP